MLFNLPEFSFVSHNPRILFQSNIMFETLLGWTMHTFQLFYIIHMPLTFPVQNCAILLFTPLWKSFWIAQCRICICFWAPIICFQTSICYHQTWTKLLYYCFGRQASFFFYVLSVIKQIARNADWHSGSCSWFDGNGFCDNLWENTNSNAVSDTICVENLRPWLLWSRSYIFWQERCVFSKCCFFLVSGWFVCVQLII